MSKTSIQTATCRAKQLWQVVGTLTVVLLLGVGIRFWVKEKATRLDRLTKQVEVAHNQPDRKEEVRLRYLQLKEQERVLGLHHPETIATLRWQALCLINLRELDAAEPLFLRVLAVRRRQLGPSHTDTLTSMSDLAGLMYQKHNFEPAETLMRHILAERERVSGRDSHATWLAICDLMSVLISKGDFPGQVVLRQRNWDDVQRLRMLPGAGALSTLRDLVSALEDSGNPAGAEKALETASQAFLAELGAEHEHTREVAQNLADFRRRVAAAKLLPSAIPGSPVVPASLPPQ